MSKMEKSEGSVLLPIIRIDEKWRFFMCLIRWGVFLLLFLLIRFIYFFDFFF